ncbi:MULTISPECIES: substrate-binding domain-containing protein [unclassified Curtobacterium]|uniref:substrate-binding domain-containing protein n=1 Tax=unclassified Curtobacterium TaxID=257496 RepID=UPI001C652EA9|nr:MULTISPECIES: substrate-binding domain-containing protein [unclassified Curtobacterium]
MEDDAVENAVAAMGAGPGPSRRGLVRGAGLAGAAALASGLLSFSGGDMASAAGKAGNFPSTPGFKFVFINHVTTNTFFQATQYGLADAASMLGLPKPQWTGSETSNVSQMVSAFNTAVSGGVDGIAVSLVDKTAFNEPVKKALAAGIPVVSYNADVTGNGRLNYIGQDLYASGQAAGEHIAKLLPNGSKIAIFIATPGALNIQPRADGAIAALKAANKGFQVKQIATGADEGKEQSAIDAFYTGNKDYKGLFAVDAGSTQGVANVMKKYDLASQGYKGGGWDLLASTEKSIRHGILSFTIDQSAYLQGFLPTLYLYLYKLSGTLVAPPLTDTGLKFVTKKNVKPYLKSTNRFEGSSSAQKYLTS